jgi:hypothetical protein
LLWSEEEEIWEEGCNVIFGLLRDVDHVRTLWLNQVAPPSSNARSWPNTPSSSTDGVKLTSQTSCASGFSTQQHIHRTFCRSHPLLTKTQFSSIMAANEVNDIVMRLLAAADHIHGREKEEILHLVGRLSRAAVCERTAAVDEMQKLRKKIVQQSAELKRITNAAQVPKVYRPPLVT